MTDPLANLLWLRPAPPGLPAGFLERPRLEGKLAAAALGPITVVCAGPGHGKTFTLASWVRRRSGGMSPGWRWTTRTTTRRCSGPTCSAR